MRKVLTLAAVVSAVVAGCGSGGASQEADGTPVVVVTTSILGDVVASAAGGLVTVDVVMPRGADPHDFAPSSKAVTEMESADLVVAVGGGFEAGMTDVIDAVERAGTPVLRFVDAAGLLDNHGDHDVDAGDGHDEHGDDHGEHPMDADDDHDEGHQSEPHDEPHDEPHGHDGVDPHMWTDPVLMIEAVEALGVRLADLDGIDLDRLTEALDAYLDALSELHAGIRERVDDIPVERRVLVTNHEVFGHFAARFGFEVVGTVVPSLTTGAETSARELEELAETIRAEGVPAIFVETTQSTDLAEALAAEVGDEVALVELYTESLGEPDGPASTYIDMMLFDADRIAEALAP